MRAIGWPWAGEAEDADWQALAASHPGARPARVSEQHRTGYVLVTKADLIAGFNEAFGELGRIVEGYDPDALVLAFLQATYETAAVNGDWDRDALEVRGGPEPAPHGGDGPGGAARRA